jgi:hypothetical protein
MPRERKFDPKNYRDKRVLWHWFSYRRRSRTKPVIGNNLPPSPLDSIQPEGWLPEYTSRKIKEVIRAAELRDELSFTSFRHGGFTEGGDAELTDCEMPAQGRHTTVKVLPKYTKRTTRQIMNGAKKRRAS